MERLHAAGLTLHRYEYRGSPRRAVGADGRWSDLETILARHLGARLLLIGEPAALVDSAKGTVHPWVPAAGSGPRRGLLTTRRPPRAWQDALTAADFAVTEIGSDGLHTLALHLTGIGSPGPGTTSATTVPLPRLLQDTPRWSRPTAPPAAEQDALLDALEAYLGPDGRYLLAALAAYPQLHWGLTRVLDLALFPWPLAKLELGPGADVPGPAADRQARERRLLQIARPPGAARAPCPTGCAACSSAVWSRPRSGACVSSTRTSSGKQPPRGEAASPCP